MLREVVEGSDAIEPIVQLVHLPAHHHQPEDRQTSIVKTPSHNRRQTGMRRHGTRHPCQHNSARVWSQDWSQGNRVQGQPYFEFKRKKQNQSLPAF